MSHTRRRPALVAVVSSAALTLAACGGSDSSSATDAPTVATVSATDAATATVAPDTAAPVTAPAETAAPTTVPATDAPDTAPPATAAFDGPHFVDVIDAALAPYAGAIGLPADPAAVGAAAPLAADIPLPPGAAITGAGRRVEESFGEFDETQQVGLGPAATGAGLEAFGAAAPAGWTQASYSTSGTLFTLLLTNDADGRRAVYVVQEDATDSSYPPLEVRVTPTQSTLVEPAWAAALPRLGDGTLVEVAEAVGQVSAGFAVAGNGFVTARWRYPESALSALEAYLESGVVTSAGFTYDQDLFNGFEQMVDVTAGDWTGTVIIGQATINDEVFYDLVWTLQRP